MSPKISVVMPVWNGEKYLRAAIDSVLAQTLTDFEFIVVDDGSTDGTAAILASYSDARIKVCRLEHGGIVTALNVGLSAASAEWIARQDADDICRPERFAGQWNAVKGNAKAVLCFCDTSLIGDDAGKIQRARFPRTKAFVALRLCFECPIVHSSVLFRKEAAQQVGGYRSDERHAEDFALWGRMLELGDFIALPERLQQLRVHPESVSQGNLERQRALTEEIAVEHCRRFMRLTDLEARRAFAILATPSGVRERSDWRWFRTYCAPRLPWRSNEARAWLLFQSLKQWVRR